MAVWLQRHPTLIFEADGVTIRKHVCKKRMSFLERMNAAVSPASPSGRIMKNVVVISAAFMIQFTAFQSMAALQSTRYT